MTNDERFDRAVDLPSKSIKNFQHKNQTGIPDNVENKDVKHSEDSDIEGFVDMSDTALIVCPLVVGTVGEVTGVLQIWIKNTKVSFVIYLFKKLS